MQENRQGRIHPGSGESFNTETEQPSVSTKLRGLVKVAVNLAVVVIARTATKGTPLEDTMMEIDQKNQRT